MTTYTNNLVKDTYNLGTVALCDLSKVFKKADGCEEVLNALKLSNSSYKYLENEYGIIKYNKNKLHDDMISSSGLFRSVIHRDGKILAFAPPKSHCAHKFTFLYPPEECIAEEYVEGTMINLFFDSDQDKWEIATRSSIGAKNTFFKNGKFKDEDTFSHMFYEVCDAVGLSRTFDALPKEYCYSFVFQHLRNRIVVPITKMRLYLVAVYKINNETYNIENIDRTTIPGIGTENQVEFPKAYRFETYDDLHSLMAIMNDDIKNVGIMIYHKPTNARTKFRNLQYEFVRHLRGNQPKLQYHYLELRQKGQVKPYLKYFPEHTAEFTVFKNQIHVLTDDLYSSYVSCYIEKEKPLIEFPPQIRTHMFFLHQTYKESLLPPQKKRRNVTKSVVIDYINILPPAKLMSTLNFDMRVSTDK